MDTPEMLAILLLLVGLALLIAEFFIPSGGLIGVLALISVVGSVVFAVQAWWTDSPILFWTFIGSILVLTPTCVFGAAHILPRTAWGRRLMLPPPSGHEITGFQEELEHLERLVGCVGQTTTALNPGGMLEIDGERLHCEGDGMMLEPGEFVEVVAVRGNRLQVRPTDRREEDGFTSGEEPPLDFEDLHE